MTLDLPKLRWRCRRGMLELDLLLNPFLENKFPQLSHELQENFILLLDEADPDIYNWLLEAEIPPKILQPIVDCLRDYHKHFTT